MTRIIQWIVVFCVAVSFSSELSAQRFEIATDDAQFVDQPGGSKLVANIARGKKIYGLKLIKKTGWVKAVEPKSQLPAWISLRKLRLIRSAPGENEKAKEISKREDQIWAVSPATIKQYNQSMQLVKEIRQTRSDLYPTTPIIVGNAALMAQRVSMYAKAESLHKLSIKMTLAIYGKDSLEVAKCQQRLGLMLVELSRASEGLPILGKVRKVFIKEYGRDDPRTASIAIPFGDAHFEIDENKDAVKFYQMAYKSYRKHYGPKDQRTIKITLRLANATRDVGDKKEAIKLFRETVQTLETMKNARPSELAATRLRLAVLELKATDERGLQKIVDGLSEFQKRFPNQRVVGNSIAKSLTNQLIATGNQRQLLSYADYGIKRLRIKLRQELWGVADDQQDSLVSVRGAATFFNALTVASTFKDIDGASTTSLEWLINGKGLVRDTKIAKANSDGNANARQQWIDERYVTLPELMNEIPANGVYIDIIRYLPIDLATGDYKTQYRYLAWVARKNAKPKIVDLGRANTIERRIKTFRRLLLESSDKMKDESEREAYARLKPSLTKLSKSIWQPIQKEVGDASIVMISPDQAAWMVPWSAMLNTDGTFAVEKFEIQSVISGREIVRAKTSASPRRNQAPVIFANPDYGQKLSNNNASANRGMTLNGEFGQLEYSQQEADFVAPALKFLLGKTAQVFVSKNAQEARFKSLTGPPVILFSTHGYFVDAESQIDQLKNRAHSNFSLLQKQRGNPLMNCGLVLAGGNQHRAIERFENDGILTGVEIAKADLRGTQLVVLSACETGLGSLAATGGAVGLRQAFHLAGAKSVLASLWKVNDKETALMMKVLVRDLTKTKDVRKSLRAAQLRYIEQHRRDGAAHPYFWAGFLLSGQAKF